MSIKWHKPIAVSLTASAFLIIACCTRAGEYHTSQKNVCSDCHVMHASKEAETWTPTEKLLKNSAGEIALCMTCHDGSDTQAPDIVASGTAGGPSNTVTTKYTSKHGSSAGFFQNDYLMSANPCGHDLRPSVTATAPFSTTYSKPGGLVCSDCHNPHGTGNYRNLLSDPNPNHPGSYNIVIGTQVKETTPVNDQNPNPAVAYDTTNISFYTQNNIGEWCADCHDGLAQNSTGSSPAHFKAHPSGVQIGGYSSHVDTSNWQSGLPGETTGFGTDIGDSTAGIPRLRYGSPTGSNTVAGSSDTMLCLSCHKAHGSKYKYSLVWPYNETGADMLSGCQQCHFK